MRSLSRLTTVLVLLTVCGILVPAVGATPPKKPRGEAKQDDKQQDDKRKEDRKEEEGKDNKRKNDERRKDDKREPDKRKDDKRKPEKPKDEKKKPREKPKPKPDDKNAKPPTKKPQPEKKPQPDKKPKGKKESSKPQPKPEPPAAAPKPKPPTHNPRYAATSVADADADFAWQGEYAGCVYTPGAGHRELGLQVVALGDSKYDGVVYSGGLPGAGWDGRRKTAVTGSRKGALLSMSGSLLTARVQPTHADIYDTSGNQIGTLEKTIRRSPTLGKQPSPAALVVFDGTSTELFDGASMTDDGLLQVGGTTKFLVQDFYLHLEFRTPYMPFARGQGRGNSGVYIQRRYEVQILDSFGLSGEPNECGGLYLQKRPDVNMALPPLTWQTYDIYFRAARYNADGRKVTPAYITVLHNGVPIHTSHAIKAKTGAGRPEGPEPMPIHLQNHTNPVVFRNIWIQPLDSNSTAACP